MSLSPPSQKHPGNLNQPNAPEGSVTAITPAGEDPPHGLPPEVARYLVTRLDDLIRIEFDLIGYRMTWLVISQSFLFGAFSAAAAANPETSHKVLQEMLKVLPIVGILLAAIAWAAIYVAQGVIEKLKKMRVGSEKEAFRHEGYVSPSVSISDHTHWLGNLPPFSVPFVLGLAWVYLLVLVLRG